MRTEAPAPAPVVAPPPPVASAPEAMAAVLVAAAVPTVAMDVHNAQDISNDAWGPGFPWTLVLSRDEVEALDWLKTHTPADVLVQPNVAERSNASWGYMTAFGERRMAAACSEVGRWPPLAFTALS